MPKIKLERIAGVVALSYLVLIPAGGILAYLKIRQIDQDVTALWDGTEPSQRPTAMATKPLDQVVESCRSLGRSLVRDRRFNKGGIGHE